MSYTEKHYTPKEVGKLLHLAESTVRGLFSGLPGVVTIERPRLKAKRPYTTIRISESALSDWYGRHGGGFTSKGKSVGRVVKKSLVGSGEVSVVPLSGSDRLVS